MPVFNMTHSNRFYYMLIFLFSVNTGAMMIVMVGLD